MKIKIFFLSVCITLFSGFSQNAGEALTADTQLPAFELTSKKIQDLSVLCKVWGFLKYYHPAVRNGNYNWDNELLKMLPKIIQCQTKQERNAALLNWVNETGTFKIRKNRSTDSSLIKLYPDLNWLNDTSALGTGLQQQLDGVRNAKRDTTSYYVTLANAGNPLFLHEDPYPQKLYPDNGMRLVALFRYWNMIAYYYPDRQLTGESWADVLEHYIPLFLNDANELDYKLTTLTLIACIHDSHADIWGDRAALAKFRGKNTAWFKAAFIENKAVITDCLGYGKYKDSTLRRGDVILNINGKNIADLIKQRALYAPASNYPAQLRDLAMDLFRTNDTTLDVTYMRNDIVESARLDCSLNPREAYRLAHEKKDTCFKYIKPGIAYLYAGNVRNSALDRIMSAATNSKGLIIDLRCYPSEFIVFSLGKYLFQAPAPFAIVTTASLDMPGVFSYKNKVSQIGKENGDYYKGKIIILVNEETQSNAEYTAMAFRAAPKTIVIGSTTAGADGNVSEIYLPGGIRTVISGIGIYYPDGRETQRVGIVPDIIAQPTVKGIIENRDEVLEKAIELLQ